MQVDTRPDTISNIASYFGVNSAKLQRHYKRHVSGFKQWDQFSHAEDYLIYPENITESISIDEVSLSKGELYTIVTNKQKSVKNRACVIAIINGTEAKTIQSVLERIPLEKRNQVKEVSMDMARNMALAVDNCFPNCRKVIDRFHVVRLVLDALQHIRVKLRWEAIEEDNTAIKLAKSKGEKYKPELFVNGDTLKELLVRSKHLLYKFEHEWTINQAKRAAILFERYPVLREMYKLTLQFRNIYNSTHKFNAVRQLNEWKEKVIKLQVDEFNALVYSIDYHFDNILNFFDNRSTNGYAESINSKIKAFRANLRGVTDIKFFLFRLQKLFA